MRNTCIARLQWVYAPVERSRAQARMHAMCKVARASRDVACPELSLRLYQMLPVSVRSRVKAQQCCAKLVSMPEREVVERAGPRLRS